MFPAPKRLWAVRRASWADLGLGAEALFWLAAARLLVAAGSFHVLARRMKGGTPARFPPSGSAELRKIGWSLTAVGRRVPWRCKCLERAIAGAMMLRLRGRPATLFLGVARSEPGGTFEAHAWLRCGCFPVVGEETPTSGYTVVARFGYGERH